MFDETKEERCAEDDGEDADQVVGDHMGHICTCDKGDERHFSLTAWSKGEAP